MDVQLRAAAAAGWLDALRRAETETDLPPGLLLALALRESGLDDGAVVSADGHRHGLLGIDDRAHGGWLASRGAGAPPPVDQAAGFVAGLLEAYLQLAETHGVPESLRLKFALSAYDSGTAAALESMATGDSDLGTRGGDYGGDVLRRHEEVTRWLVAREGPGSLPTLSPGASGPAVVDLKRRLREWYADTGRPIPRRMRGPVYGLSAVEAVREFQRENGIVADGVVGPETWSRLIGGAEPASDPQADTAA